MVSVTLSNQSINRPSKQSGRGLIRRLGFASLLTASLGVSPALAAEPGAPFISPVTMTGMLWAAQEYDLDLDIDSPSDFDDLSSDVGFGDEGDLGDDDFADEDDESRRHRSIFGSAEERLPTMQGGHFILPRLRAATTDTSEIGDGSLPEGFRDGADAPLVNLPESLFDRGLPGGYTISNWAAPNTFSMPRYFEDRMLERHGHERFPLAQPFISGAKFFVTIPILPYLMTVQPPCECEYQLGYYRAGSCAPALFQLPPYERRALLGQGAALATGIVAFP